MTFSSDFLGVLGILLACVAWLYPNALAPLREFIRRKWLERKHSKNKRQLISTRRKIAKLKISRKIEYRIFVMQKTQLLMLGLFGLALMVASTLVFPQKIDPLQKNTQLIFFGIFYFIGSIIYLVPLFLNRKTNRAYVKKLADLSEKRTIIKKRIANA
jgi:hypothetical protein